MLTAALDAALISIQNRYVCKQGMVAIIKSYYKTNLKSMLTLWHIIYVFLEYACYVIRARMQEYSGAPPCTEHDEHYSCIYRIYLLAACFGSKALSLSKVMIMQMEVRIHYKCMCEKERL